MSNEPKPVKAEISRDRNLVIMPQEGQMKFGLTVTTKDPTGTYETVAQKEQPVEILMPCVMQSIENVFEVLKWEEGHPKQDELTPYILCVSHLNDGNQVINSMACLPVVFGKDGKPRVKGNGQPPIPVNKPAPVPADKPADKTVLTEEVRILTERLEHINTDAERFEEGAEKQIRPPHRPLGDMAYSLAGIRNKIVDLKSKFPNDPTLGTLQNLFNDTSVRVEELVKLRNKMRPLSETDELKKRLAEIERRLNVVDATAAEQRTLKVDMDTLRKDLSSKASTEDVNKLAETLERQYQKFASNFEKKISSEIKAGIEAAFAAQKPEEQNGRGDNKNGGKQPPSVPPEDKQRRKKHGKWPNSIVLLLIVFGILALIALMGTILFGFMFSMKNTPAAGGFERIFTAPPGPPYGPIPNAGSPYERTPAPTAPPTPLPHAPPPPPAAASTAPVSTGNVEMVPFDAPPAGATPVAYQGTTLVMHEKVPVYVEEKPVAVSYETHVEAPSAPTYVPAYSDVTERNLYVGNTYRYNSGYYGSYYGGGWYDGNLYTGNCYTYGMYGPGIAFDLNAGWTPGTWAPHSWQPRHDGFANGMHLGLHGGHDVHGYGYGHHGDAGHGAYGHHR